MMRRLILFFSLCLSPIIHLFGYECIDEYPRDRADNIPAEHIAGMDDEYFTGYIQALIDMHYYEFQVRVLAVDRTVYVFDLPCNEVISNSIICFIYDIPCVAEVRSIACSPSEFLCTMRGHNEKGATKIEKMCAYQSLCYKEPCQVRAIWLPQNTVLFQPLVADPRQPTNFAALRFNDDVVGKHVGACAFGGDFVIVRLLDVLRWQGDMDLGIQAGIFSVFNLENPLEAMVNTDFFVSFLGTYAINKWSYRFRLWHLSSHIGDEFLLMHPDFDRRNLSDNGVDFFASYQLNQALRVYAGIGYIMFRDREFPSQPLYFEAGSEVRCFGCRDRFNKLYVQPFLAMHFRLWEELNFDVDQTYALGVEWSKLQNVGRKLRIFFEFHDGYSYEGQFNKDRANYFAVKCEYGF